MDKKIEGVSLVLSHNPKLKMSCCGYTLPEKWLEWALCLEFLETSQLVDWQRNRIQKGLLVSDKQDWSISIPPILQGVTYQSGENGTGMLQTLDYCEWDSEGHRLRVGMWQPGVWVGGYRDVQGRFKSNILSLCCQIQCGRLLGSSYLFQFNPDLTRGEIHLAPFQCCPSCLVPSWCIECVMERGIKEMEVWDRISRVPCLGMSHVYQLKKVIEYGVGEGEGEGEWKPVQPHYDEMILQSPERLICLR